MEKALEIVVESVLYPFQNFGKIVTLLLITALAMSVISLLLLPILPDIAAGNPPSAGAGIRILLASVLTWLVIMPFFRGVVDNAISGKDVVLGDLGDSLSLLVVIIKLVLIVMAIVVLPVGLLFAVLSAIGLGAGVSTGLAVIAAFLLTLFVFSRYVMMIGLHVDKKDASLGASQAFSAGHAVLILVGVYGTLIVVRILQFLVLGGTAMILPDVGSQIGLVSGLLSSFIINAIALFTGSMAMAAIGKTYVVIKGS